MFHRVKIQKLDDFFTELAQRREKGVYFYRINGYNNDIDSFIQKLYEIARVSGVVVEGGIPNPDQNNLSYYNEIMGMSFQMNTEFISQSLKKWLPRMNSFQRENVTNAIYKSLDDMRKKGKNDNMLKNAYIKIMCGLYYKFERIVNQLGLNKVPKILYEGYVNNYEIMLLSVLSNAGCDVVLLQYNGDNSYLKIDPQSEHSDNFQGADLKSFPDTFNLKWVRSQIQNKMNTERLYGKKPDVINCTNAWIEGKGFSDIITPVVNRGNDSRFFYNCFIRINGVEDKTYYVNQLFQFYTELKTTKRNILIFNESIPKPTTNEISEIKRNNYTSKELMLADLSKNFSSVSNQQLQRLLVKAFIDVMLSISGDDSINLNKLINKAVYLLCWSKRYFSQLFAVDWKLSDISCCILLGGCKDSNEALFLSFLSRLPVDVLILTPNLNIKCCLEDKSLYEINNALSLNINKFPTDNSEIHIGTAAYHAERELDTIMYQDSGMYRNRQYSKAVAVTLQTMYEEIEILWDQELKYRPNFSTTDQTVNMPVIFAKVCGVKDGDLQLYWAGVKKLIVDDTYVVSNIPLINPSGFNPIKGFSVEFFKNGKLQRSRIKSHQCYQYSVLREDVQEYILDKLQLLIDQRIIKGTFQNGMEYNIIATILNMNKDIVRMIQNFDFTKKNPKLLYLYTTEKPVSIEDAILMAYLNLIGFDIVFFVPTGYQCVEKFYNKQILVEHQCGEYVYDLGIPDFRKVSTEPHLPWHKKIFKRGS